MIDEVALTRLRILLRTPYKLAFGPVTHFDTILAQVSGDGRVGSGEATILTGYTDETIDESWARAVETAGKLPGASSESAKAAIANSLPHAPFTATALTTAIEMLEGHPALEIERIERVPLLFGVNATEHDEIAREIETAIASGFRTLKVKVGFDVDSDLQRVGFIQRQNNARAALRLDANQGYAREEARRFASALDPSNIELLEQPSPARDWEALEAVAKVAAVPLMLDESIYTEADIERAARIGASFVKLKLMKCVSLDKLERGLARVRDLGMEPVLGNGVASDIGCWMEACVARRQVRNAGEMNGFLRQAVPLARPPLRVESGALRLDPDGAPQLDTAALKGSTIDRALFRRTRGAVGTVA